MGDREMDDPSAESRVCHQHRLVLAPVDEIDPRPDDRVVDHAGDQDLAGSGQGTAKGGQPFQVRGERRVLPYQVNVSEARDTDRIRPAPADDLVGDLGPSHIHISG